MNCPACFVAVLLVLFRVPALAQDAAGDWIGQLNEGFKVQIHIAKTNTAYNGYLTNPSGNPDGPVYGCI